MSTGEQATGPSRRAELAANIAGVEARVAAACAAAGRPRADVQVIAITKTFPASDARLLVELGLRDLGENRDQEAAPKAAALRDLRAQGLRWHFVGGLQTNKAASVAGYADVVHSVDRLRLVSALAAGAAKAGRVLRCLVQVDLDEYPRPGRSGARPADVELVADAVAAAPGLVLGGLMAVAPLGGDPASAFAELARLAAALRASHPEALTVSAGMSGDLEAAVAAGATHLRVGTALLGVRSGFVG